MEFTHTQKKSGSCLHILSFLVVFYKYYVGQLCHCAAQYCTVSCLLMCFLSARFLPTQPLPTHHLSAMVLFVSFNSGAKLLLRTLHLWKNKHQDQKQHISDFLKSMNAFISPSHLLRLQLLSLFDLLSLCARYEPHWLTTIFFCLYSWNPNFLDVLFLGGGGLHNFNSSVSVLRLHVSSQKDAKKKIYIYIYFVDSQTPVQPTRSSLFKRLNTSSATLAYSYREENNETF